VVINSEILASSYGDGVKNFFAKHRIRYFGIGRNGNIKVKNINSSLTGSKVVFEYNKKEYTFTTNIIGSFQAVNLLIAAKMTANLGVNFDHIVEVLEKVTAVTGRLQRIGFVESEVQVFVDYAHTPDALENVLSTIKKLRKGHEQVITVVGCGGDRDKTKRPVMANIATNFSNKVILTSDNPRTENAEAILDDMEAGVEPQNYKKMLRITDRKQAIKTAVSLAKTGDIILIAGKGHENYQIIGKEVFEFDDMEIVKSFLIRNY
jgi:UDP-N-acetylmuramoyl-L-alanyl-D-glutamate--2,6-diaminopimelate ligase